MPLLDASGTVVPGTPEAWTGDGPEATSCAWCGAALQVTDVRAPGRILCSACAVWTTSPWPTDAQLDVAYGTWYRPGAGRFGGPGDALLRRLRGSLARRVDRVAPRGRVLDVGAGDGTLVEALRRRGRDAIGLERHDVGPHVRAGDLTTVDGPFAAIVLWHSLEHLREPRAALRRAAELLMPGGVLVLALPNIASSQAAAFGERWLALDLPRHLVQVPAERVVSELHDLGLRPERVSHARGGQVVFGWLHGFVGRLPGHPDLYDAIRRPEARAAAIGPGQRAATLAAATVLAPVAAGAAIGESLRRRGGSFYIEARR